MSRDKIYKSEKLPKFVFGYTMVVKALNICSDDQMLDIHKSISSKVETTTRNNIEKYFNDNGLIIGQDVRLLNESLSMLPTPTLAISSNSQVHFSFDVLNPNKYLSKLKLDRKLKVKSAFNVSICAQGFQLFTLIVEKSPIDQFNISEDRQQLDYAEDEIHFHRPKFITDLNFEVLSNIPREEYKKLFIDILFKEYRKKILEVPKYYIVNSPRLNICYYIKDNKNALDDLTDYFKRVDNAKLLRSLKQSTLKKKADKKIVKI